MAEQDRQLRIEDAITKLTEISSELKSMLALHELRLTQQEKITDSIEIIMEKRRDEVDQKFNDFYSEVKEENNKIHDKIISQEKILYTYIGGFSVIAFCLAYWDKIKLFLTKV